MVEATSDLLRSLASAKASKLSAGSRLEKLRESALDKRNYEVEEKVERNMEHTENFIQDLEYKIKSQTGQAFARKFSKLANVQVAFDELESQKTET